MSNPVARESEQSAHIDDSPICKRCLREIDWNGVKDSVDSLEYTCEQFLLSNGEQLTHDTAVHSTVACIPSDTCPVCHAVETLWSEKASYQQCQTYNRMAYLHDEDTDSAIEVPEESNTHGEDIDIAVTECIFLPPPRETLLPADELSFIVNKSSAPKKDPLPPLLWKLRIPGMPNHFGAYRSVPRIVDMNLLRHWVRISNARPNEPLSSFKLNTPKIPVFRLINVVKGCIEIFPYANLNNHVYTALSYVWGGQNTLRYSDDTAEQFSKPGVLFDVSKPPRTIADAMKVTKDLDLTYLWVDVLCVKQDNPDLKSELSHVGAIYTSACLTIIAMDSKNADTGLPGLSYEREELKSVPLTVTHGGQTIHGELSEYPYYDCKTKDHAISAGSAWDSRGWTLQEQVLSCRKLSFTKHGAFYTDIWGKAYSEMIDFDSNFGEISSIPITSDAIHDRMLFSGHKDEASELLDFETLCSKFSDRIVAFDDDYFYAFKGILDSFAKYHHQPHIWGLFLNKWAHGLAWVPADENQPPQRRVSTGTAFPSWSWFGWKCGVGNSMCDYETPSTSCPATSGQALAGDTPKDIEDPEIDALYFLHEVYGIPTDPNSPHNFVFRHRLDFDYDYEHGVVTGHGTKERDVDPEVIAKENGLLDVTKSKQHDVIAFKQHAIRTEVSLSGDSLTQSGWLMYPGYEGLKLARELFKTERQFQMAKKDPNYRCTVLYVELPGAGCPLRSVGGLIVALDPETGIYHRISNFFCNLSAWIQAEPKLQWVVMD